MKLLIYTQLWRRPDITEICFISIDRIRKSFPEYEVQAFAVLSEESFIPLCERYKIKHCFAENLPLGRKHNTGLREALKLQWDYMLNVGSDDIVSNKLIELYKPYFKQKNDFFGVTDIGFLDSESKILVYSKVETEYPFGAARVVSRKLVEKVGDLWPDDWNKTLDRGSQEIIKKHEFECTKIVANQPYLIDIKSNVNIWGFNKYVGINLSINYISENFSVKELNKILDLKTMKAKRYIYRNHTTASLKIKNKNGVAERIVFSDGGFIGGGDAGASKFIDAQLTVYEDWKQEIIEAHPLFKQGIIICIKDEARQVNPLEAVEGDDEEKTTIVEPTTVQEGMNVVLAMFPDVKSTQVNSAKKLKAFAIENNLDFPNVQLG